MKAAGLISESISGVRWIALGKIVQLISWAMTILVIRLLHPADYGLATLAAVTTMLMGLLMDAG